MDISSISAAISGIKSATDIAKIMKDSKLTLKDAEAQLQLATLISNLADAHVEMANIKMLLTNKDEEIRELQDKLSIKDDIVYEPPYYFVQKDGEKEGPYCQHCYDKNIKLIRLQNQGAGAWQCMVCKNYVEDGNYVEPNLYKDNYL